LKYFKGFVKYLPLLRELVVRDIKTRYRRSVLGLLWTLLNPLLMMMILTIVFSSLFKSNIQHFPVYLLAGQTVFNFFSESTVNAMNSIISSGSLIRKVYIPKYLFVLSKVLSTLVNLVASFIALLIVMVVTGVQFHGAIIWSVFPIIYIFILAIGFGLILSSLAVFFRDTVHFYGILLTAWMYLTPMFYPFEILPDNVKPFVEANPMYGIITCLRSLILEGRAAPLQTHAYCLAVSVAFLFIGLLVFYKKQDRFILHI